MKKSSILDNIFSFIIFFLFVFALLVSIKNLFLEENYEKSIEIKNIKSANLVNNFEEFNIKNCYQVLEANKLEYVVVNDTLNPKIKGLSLIKEELICNIMHNNSFKSKIKVIYN